MMQFWTNLQNMGNLEHLATELNGQKYNGQENIPSNYMVLDNKKLRMHTDEFSFLLL